MYTSKFIIKTTRTFYLLVSATPECTGTVITRSLDTRRREWGVPSITINQEAQSSEML